MKLISIHQSIIPQTTRMSVPLFNLAPNLTVSRLCLGTMTFGQQNSLPESFQLLDQAFHSGINFFDSAEMYPVPQRAHTQGRSEEYLGCWIKDRRISRDRVVLATKVAGPSGQMTWIRGGPECLDSKNITEAIDNSLMRLQTDYIDLYQIHWPDRYVPMFGETDYDPARQYSSTPIEDQLHALSKAIDAGKVRYIGLSNETPYGLMKFLQASDRVEGHPMIVSLQNSYSLLCRTFDSALAECCHHESVFLLAYSPLAMGILSGKYFSDGGPSDARLNLFKGRYSEGESRYNLSNVNITAATREYLLIAKKYGLHPVSLAIAFVLKHPLVASAVFGATKMWQLQEVLNACHVQLTAEIVAEINTLFGFKNVGEVRVPLRSLVESGGDGNVKFVSYEVRSPEGKHNGVLDFSYKVIRKDDNHLAEFHNHHNNNYPLDCKHDDHDTATTSSDRHFSECHEQNLHPNQQSSSNPEKIQYPKIDVEDLSDIIPICASPIIATNISHRYSPAPVRVYPPSELQWGRSLPVPFHFPPPPSPFVIYPPPPCVDPHFGYYNRAGEYNQQG